ncbi:MAG: hypothetical protein IJZ53_00915 [Tyzzerella sp.]|nr:hypothetical protein [Tyzzerella sp.]
MVTKTIFDEIRVLRQKLLKLEAIKNAGVDSSVCRALIQQMEKDIELLWVMVSLSFEGLDYWVKKTIELYYFRALSVEQISEYFYRGTKSAAKVRKIITDFLIDLNIKNQYGLPPLYNVSESK